MCLVSFLCFINDLPASQFYTLSLHDALPISIFREAWPTENVTLIGRRSPLRTETRQRLRRAESYRHVASYAESRLREGRSEERRVGKECRSRWSRHH